MATDQRNLPAFFNTDADFQSWCQGIHAQLAAAGLVNTADTGQINNTTVTKPAAINTSQGYEIWRFADTLQSTYPIFLKIEYGSGGAVDRPSLWLTAGTVTNGAGTLTGVPITTRRQIPAIGSKSAGVTLPSYCCGDGSRLSLMTNYDSASNSFAIFICVDRLRDSSGNATSEGFVMFNENASSAGALDTVLGNALNLATAASARFVGVSVSGNSPHGGGLTATGGNVAVMPPMVMNGRPRFLLGWCLYSNNAPDIAGGTAFSATVLGSSHTFMALPQTNNSMFVGTADRIAMIWE